MAKAAKKTTSFQRKATKTPAKPAAMGRPTGYRPEHVGVARKMAEMGATVADFANAFNVSISTVSLWMVTHPDFSEAIKAGRVSADARVEHSLYQRATGYEHDETDIRVVDGAIAMTPVRKVYPPDTTAAIFWLKNRKPDEWRDMKAMEHTGKDGGPIETRSLSDEDRDKRIAELLAKRGK